MRRLTKRKRGNASASRDIGPTLDIPAAASATGGGQILEGSLLPEIYLAAAWRALDTPDPPASPFASGYLLDTLARNKLTSGPESSGIDPAPIIAT